MNTKAKALVASAIVIALALATVSGVTYSWFSDSEESTINITTGKVDIELENITVKKYTDGVEGELLSGTETHEVKNGSIIMKLGNICPGDKVVLSFNIKDDSKITCKYRYSLLADDYNGLFKGLNIDATYENATLTQAGYTDWKDEVSETGTISIELPTSAGNEYQSKSVILKFGIEAYQANADIITSEDALTIQTLDDLKYFAYSVNNGNDYSGKTVTLAADIDLKNELWTPIGPNSDAGNKFRGTFDGQNHTISNLKIDTASEHKYQATGFFGALNGKVMNLKFDGAEISGFSEGNAVGNTSNGIAVVAGSIYNSGTISGVEVKNASVSGNRYVGTISGYVYGSIERCTVENVVLTATPEDLTGNYDNGDKVGGIAGYWCSENTYSLSNNKVSGLTITAYRDAGGIVGAADAGKVNGGANPSINITDNSVNTVSIIIDQSKSYGDKEPNAGGICGRLLNCSGQILDSNRANGFTCTINPIQNQTSFEFMANHSVNGNILVLATGDYTLVGGLTGKTLTLKAAENAEVRFGISSAIALNGSSLTFENLKFIYGNTDLVGIQHTADMVYTGCTIEGKITLYGTTEKFEKCKFVNNTGDYNVWTYGGKNVTFSECNFQCAGKSVLVYNVGSVQNAKIDFDGCVFNSSDANGKSAVEIDTRFSSFNVSIDNCTLEGNWSKGTVSGTELWNNKAGNALKLSIDGTEVTIKKVGFIYGETDTSSITYLEASKMSTVLNNDSIEAIVFGDSSTWNLSAFEDVHDVIFEISDSATPTLNNTPKGWTYRFYGEGYTGYGILSSQTQYNQGYFEVSSTDGLIRINEDYDEINEKLQAFMPYKYNLQYLWSYNVKLVADLDFGNSYVNTIDFRYQSIDGKNGDSVFTIKNANVKAISIVRGEGSDKVQGSYGGILSRIANISNISFENIKVTCDVANAMVGVAAGYCSGIAENVHVSESSITIEEETIKCYAGGLFGGSYAHIKGCSVSNVEISGGKSVGSLVGYVAHEDSTSTVEISGNKISTVTITATERPGTTNAFCGKLNADYGTIAISGTEISKITVNNVEYNQKDLNQTEDKTPYGQIYPGHGTVTIDNKTAPTSTSALTSS